MLRGVDDASTNRALGARPAQIRRQDGSCAVACSDFSGEPRVTSRTAVA